MDSELPNNHLPPLMDFIMTRASGEFLDEKPIDRRAKSWQQW
jgi:hypothetical protein